MCFCTERFRTISSPADPNIDAIENARHRHFGSGMVPGRVLHHLKAALPIRVTPCCCGLPGGRYAGTALVTARKP